MLVSSFDNYIFDHSILDNHYTPPFFSSPCMLRELQHDKAVIFLLSCNGDPQI